MSSDIQVKASVQELSELKVDSTDFGTASDDGESDGVGDDAVDSLGGSSGDSSITSSSNEHAGERGVGC